MHVFDKIANIYFRSDFDARNRVRYLNEYNKINLNEMRRKNMADDGVFNNSQNSNHNVDNDAESNDSHVNLKDVDDNGNGKLIIFFRYFISNYFLSFNSLNMCSILFIKRQPYY